MNPLSKKEIKEASQPPERFFEEHANADDAFASIKQVIDSCGHSQNLYSRYSEEAVGEMLDDILEFKIEGRIVQYLIDKGQVSEVMNWVSELGFEDSLSQESARKIAVEELKREGLEWDVWPILMLVEKYKLADVMPSELEETALRFLEKGSVIALDFIKRTDSAKRVKEKYPGSVQTYVKRIYGKWAGELPGWAKQDEYFRYNGNLFLDLIHIFDLSSEYDPRELLKRAKELDAPDMIIKIVRTYGGSAQESGSDPLNKTAAIRTEEEMLEDLKKGLSDDRNSRRVAMEDLYEWLQLTRREINVFTPLGDLVVETLLSDDTFIPPWAIAWVHQFKLFKQIPEKITGWLKEKVKQPESAAGALLYFLDRNDVTEINPEPLIRYLLLESEDSWNIKIGMRHLVGFNLKDAFDPRELIERFKRLGLTELVMRVISLYGKSSTEVDPELL